MKVLKSRLVSFYLTVFFLILYTDVKGALIGYWPLNETSGITATNLADGGTIGILTNGPAWTSDSERGGVLFFDGSDDHVIAGTIPQLEIGDNFTWSVWIYSQQGSSSEVILGNRWQADHSSSRWIKFTPSKFEYVAVSSPHLDYVDIVEADGWMHHAVVKTGNTLIYYRNGVPLLTNDTVNTVMPSQPFYMGGDKYGECWRGRLDDVAIWTDPLPDESIAGLADGTYTPLTAPFYPIGPFDLADTVGGGDGRLPGTGGAGDLAAVEGTYTSYPDNLFVDGTFVPNSNNIPVVIDGAGNTYDFDDQVNDNYHLPWRNNGHNFDTYPVDTNSLPNFIGDPDNHSFLAGHANKGITFDLEAIRDYTGNSISNFTACIGDSRPKVGGAISYYVLVDGVVVASRFYFSDDEDFVTIDDVSTGRYLTIVICDAGNTKSADHGYLGDPFINLIKYTPPEPPKGAIIVIQ